MTFVGQLVKVALVIYAAKRLFELFKGWTIYSRNVPRIHTPLMPMSLWAAFMPPTRFHRRLGDHWDERNKMYKKSSFDTVVMQPYFSGIATMYSRNLASWSQSLALGCDFIKAENPPLTMLGDNVVSAEGEMWKRHRRITAPAFNHTTYKNVWDTTVNVYNEMLTAEGWANVQETKITNFSVITHKLALFLIAIVGFGLPMSWIEPPRDESGKVSTQAMIFDMATFIMERWFTPRWAYYLGGEKLKRIDDAYTAFVPFMKERISEREVELRKLRATDGQTDEARAELIKDVFGRLVDARLSDGKLTLTDDELIGNAFIFTFAGHETTANTLSAIFALLALYPEEQEWVYQSIIQQLGDREPTFDDFDDLEGVLACVYEGSRLFPAAYLLARRCDKDTVMMLPHRNEPSVKEPVEFKKGSVLFLDMVGMCYDPISFPDPEAFKPQRWSSSKRSTSTPTNKATQADEVTGSSPASTFEGFLGFSWGPRTCLGHKFAKVESVAFLTMVLREWKVVVDLKGEKVEAWRARVLAPSFGQALLIGEVPLKLVRRK